MSFPDQKRALAMELVQAALAAADPAEAVGRHLCLEGQALKVGEEVYELAEGGRLLVVGAGKAGVGMAAAVEEVLGDRITAGWINVRRGYEPADPLWHIHIHPVAHPVPDAAGLEGTRCILEMMTGMDERDLVLVLISGGA